MQDMVKRFKFDCIADLLCRAISIAILKTLVLIRKMRGVIVELMETKYT